MALNKFTPTQILVRLLRVSGSAEGNAALPVATSKSAPGEKSGRGEVAVVRRGQISGPEFFNKASDWTMKFYDKADWKIKD